ncbi:MAG: glycosyltransferase [Candidatus Krumholzibacteria bacterium]|nr:glycosyltransferase [Candidatus Krumholzibacteria bacterium]
MDLSIVIVTHNSLSPVEKCLRSLEEHPPGGEYEIIVVDNASSDGTRALISESFPFVRLIANDDNRGYSKGVNQAFLASSGSYFLILNPDIVVRKDSIDALVRFMEENPEAGIAGSKLVFPDGSAQDSCRSFYTIRALFLRRTFFGKLFPRARALREHLMSDYDHTKARQVDWIIGACMIVRREAVAEVGLMDERFFLYFEDTDWCYRMKQHGRQVWYVPDSVMVHLYERSSAKSLLNKPFLLHMLSLMRYYEKWNTIFHFFRQHRGTIKSLLFVVSDMIAINFSFLAAYYLRDAIQPYFVNALYPLDWYTIFIILFNFLFLLTFTSAGLYRIRRGTGAAEEFSSVVRAVLIVFAVLLTASYLTRVRIFSRAVLLGHTVFSVFFVTLSRRLIRRVHRVLVSASFDLRRVVLAGDAGEAADFMATASDNPEAGIDIIGRVGTGEGALGGIGDLPSIVKRFRIQELIILPSVADTDGIVGIMTGPVSRSIRINIISPAARVTGRDTRSENLGGIFMFTVERGTSFLLTRGSLRLVDLAAGLILFPLSVLCWLPLAALGRTGGGAKFFSETRRGARGDICWPRVVLRSGREATDMVKPLLALQLVAGRLSLTGPPAPLAGSPGERPVVKPGISGIWRIDPSTDPGTAAENEILILNNKTFTGRILLMARSVIPCLTGRYPDWFYSKGVDR